MTSHGEQIVIFMVPISVVGAVILNGGKILSAQRKLGGTLGGLWEFPGGKVEEGESSKEALAREVREELEADIEIVREICKTTHHYDFAIVELTTFLCKIPDRRLKNKEHEAVKWLSVDDLETVEWAPADLPTIAWIKEERLLE